MFEENLDVEDFIFAELGKNVLEELPDTFEMPSSHSEGALYMVHLKYVLLSRNPARGLIMSYECPFCERACSGNKSFFNGRN